MRVSQGLTAEGSDLVSGMPRLCAAVGQQKCMWRAGGLQAGRRARERRPKTAAAEASREAAGGSIWEESSKDPLEQAVQAVPKVQAEEEGQRKQDEVKHVVAAALLVRPPQPPHRLLQACSRLVHGSL